MFPLDFRGEINQEETRVMGLLCGVSCMILTSTDRRTDGRTDGVVDGRAIAYSALQHMLSRSGVTTDPADPAMRGGPVGLWGPKIVTFVFLLKI